MKLILEHALILFKFLSKEGYRSRSSPVTMCLDPQYLHWLTGVAVEQFSWFSSIQKQHSIVAQCNIN